MRNTTDTADTVERGGGDLAGPDRAPTPNTNTPDTVCSTAGTVDTGAAAWPARRVNCQRTAPPRDRDTVAAGVVEKSQIGHSGLPQEFAGMHFASAGPTSRSGNHLLPLRGRPMNRY